MKDQKLDDFALDALVDIAVTAAEREAELATHPICFATKLARRLVLEIFPMIKAGTATRNVVEAAGRDAAREVLAQSSLK